MSSLERNLSGESMPRSPLPNAATSRFAQNLSPGGLSDLPSNRSVSPAGPTRAQFQQLQDELAEWKARATRAEERAAAIAKDADGLRSDVADLRRLVSSCFTAARKKADAERHRTRALREVSTQTHPSGAAGALAPMAAVPAAAAGRGSVFPAVQTVLSAVSSATSSERIGSTTPSSSQQQQHGSRKQQQHLDATSLSDPSAVDSASASFAFGQSIPGSATTTPPMNTTGLPSTVQRLPAAPHRSPARDADITQMLGGGGGGDRAASAGDRRRIHDVPALTVTQSSPPQLDTGGRGARVSPPAIRRDTVQPPSATVDDDASPLLPRADGEAAIPVLSQQLASSPAAQQRALGAARVSPTANSLDVSETDDGDLGPRRRRPSVHFEDEAPAPPSRSPPRNTPPPSQALARQEETPLKQPRAVPDYTSPPSAGGREVRAPQPVSAVRAADAGSGAGTPNRGTPSRMRPQTAALAREADELMNSISRLAARRRQAGGATDSPRQPALGNA